MPKRAVQTSRVEVQLNARSPIPLYKQLYEKQLYERVRGAILTGRLERGTRLPSSRQLANELGISRTTVVLAYQQLLLEGYLQSRVGRGTIVADDLPVPTVLHQTDGAKGERQPAPLRLATRVASLQEAFAPLHITGSVHGAYRGGEPAVEQFPFEVWARLIARRARRSLREVAHY